MAPQQRKTLEELKKTWYAKLKKDGFHDIEYEGGWVQNAVSNEFKTKHPLYIETTLEYYSLASSFLNEHIFDTKKEEIIWSYHCEALSIREIETILKKAEIKECSRFVIHKIVKKLEKIMKNRYLQR